MPKEITHPRDSQEELENLPMGEGMLDRARRLILGRRKKTEEAIKKIQKK